MIKQYSLKCANGYNVNMEVYNSASEVVDNCRNRRITSSRFHNMNDGNLGGNGAEWCGVASYEEALQLMREGFQPIVEKLKTELRANIIGEAKRISFKNDIVGYAPIVPLAVIGVPNSMVNQTMKKIKAKVVDVYYDGGFSSRVKSDDFIKTGSKVLSAIMKLEQQGYRFNLYRVESFADGSADMFAVKLKDASQPIDLKRISFPLAHAAFSRVIGFDWYSKVPNGKYRSGYGMPFCFEEEIKGKLSECFKEMFGSNAVYISGQKLYDKGENGEKYLMEVLTNVKSNNDN